MCPVGVVTPSTTVQQAPKPPVPFASQLILWFWGQDAPEQPPVLLMDSVLQGHYAQG